MTRPKKEKLVGFQADEAMQAALRRRAEETSQGIVSIHLRNLVQKDLENDANVPKRFDHDVLNKLAAVYTGYLAPRLAAKLERLGVDQPAVLHRLLSELEEHLAGSTVEDEKSGKAFLNFRVHPIDCTSFYVLPESFRKHPELLTDADVREMQQFVASLAAERAGKKARASIPTAGEPTLKRRAS